MLCAPYDESAKILRYLGRQVDEELINRAIEPQLFVKARSRFKQSGEKAKYGHMKTGTSNQWERKLSTDQKPLFIRELSDDLTRFLYLG